MKKNHNVFLTSYFGICLWAFLHFLWEKNRKKKIIVAYMGKCQIPPQNPY
jgi:hypothetical protein